MSLRTRPFFAAGLSLRTRLASGVAGAVVVAMSVAACSSGGSSSAASSGGNSGASGAATSITVGTSGATGVYLPLYVGVQQGVFAKYGLDVKLQTLTPSAVTAAVLSNNVNIGWDGPGLVGGILSNPSAKVFATFGPTAFYLYAKKGITSVQALKGQTVAVTTPGGAIDGAVRAAITKAGLKPGVDVKVAYLQTNSAALAAVQSGSVQAAGVSPPTSIQATQDGMSELEDITGLAPPSILAANNQWASSNGPAVTKFITAFKAAVKLAAGSQADSSAALKKYVQLTDQAQITGTWSAYKSVWAVGPYPQDQMKIVLQQLADSNPPVKGASSAKISDIVTNQYLSGS